MIRVYEQFSLTHKGFQRESWSNLCFFFLCHFQSSQWLQCEDQPQMKCKPPIKPKAAHVCFPLVETVSSAQSERIHIHWKHYHGHRFWSKGSPGSSAGKESTCNVGDPSSVPGLGRSPGEKRGYTPQYSWISLVAQLVKNPPAMWETWVGKIPWSRERRPTPVFWLGDFHGLYSSWGHRESDTTEQPSLSTSLGIRPTECNSSFMASELSDLGQVAFPV